MLEIKNLTPENILSIFKNMIELLTVKNLDEPVLQIISIFLEKLVSGYYHDLQEKKKVL
jgi:hypothetical protein